jgi:hypothetical protein
MNKKHAIIFLIILCIAGYFRLTGINWDQNQHLHPDERFLTMVATGISWPTPIYEYFNTDTSPLNPHNNGFGFYVYGTWPVIMVKGIAFILNKDNYTDIVLVGRVCSAITDLLTTILVFGIVYTITKKYNHALLAMMSYAIMPLPIQLSHFFTVDPYVTFCLTFTIWFLVKAPWTIVSVIGIGIFVGLSLAAKISSGLFLPVVGFWFLIRCVQMKNLQKAVLYSLLCLCTLLLTLHVSYPYVFSNSSVFSFTINEKVLANWKELKSYDNPDGWFPPAIQWINTIPYFTPAWNMLWICVGVPLSILFIMSLIQIIKKLNWTCILLLLWIGIGFGYQGGQFVKADRYYYQLYPIISILIGIGAIQWIRNKIICRVTIVTCILVAIIFAQMLLSIYTQPHSRITASEWIYTHIPSGSSVGTEHWDDSLPLNLPTHSNSMYTVIELPLYDKDSAEKWKLISLKLQQIDYIVISSNRLYGSISSVPDRYPMTSAYYAKLFDGSLGFKKIAEFTSRPTIPFPITICIHLPVFSYGDISTSTNCSGTGIQIIDDYVDESWTVYDHPKVTIFQKTNYKNQYP